MLFLPSLRSHAPSVISGEPSSGSKQSNTSNTWTSWLKQPADILSNAFLSTYPADSPVDQIAQQEVEARRAVLHLTLRNANELETWRNAALELDDLDGNETWKSQRESNDYDYELVESRLKQLEDARISCDPKRMLFLIRTALSRHLGGMGTVQLYRHSHIGTKHLIEQYIDTALETIAALLEQTRRSDLDPRFVMEQVLAARQSFGRSALLFSGGGTFGMNHIGVAKCLWEAKLLPRIISGSSAGSIVCSVLCCRTDDELPVMLSEFCYGELDVFVEEGTDDGALRRLARLLKHGAIYDVNNIIRVMRGLLGDITFQEAYNRTRRILNICVSSAGVFELPRLLNYLTAPNVIIWSAVQASCAVPGVFTPLPLMAKDPRTGEAVPWNPSTQSFIDGSVDGDLPMTRLSEMFNVNHFIVSQVNPHVVPFLGRDQATLASEALVSDVAVNIGTVGPSWVQKFATVARDEALHRMQVMSELGVFPTLFTKVRSILNQRYSGDITIFPEIPYSWFGLILENPTSAFMLQACHFGERGTWPQLSRVQNHCAIELALDDAIQQLRARVAFSTSQVDLRTLSRSTAHNGGPLSSRKQQSTLEKHSETPPTLKRSRTETNNVANQSRILARSHERKRAARPLSADLTSQAPMMTSALDVTSFRRPSSSHSLDNEFDDADTDEDDYFTMPIRRTANQTSKNRPDLWLPIPAAYEGPKQKRSSAGSTPFPPQSPANGIPLESRLLPTTPGGSPWRTHVATLSGTGLLRSNSYLINRRTSAAPITPLATPIHLDDEQGAANDLQLRRRRSMVNGTSAS